MDYIKYSTFLSGLHYFKDMPKDDIKNWFLNNHCTVSFFKKGEIIHLQHDVCISMDIIHSGAVSMQKINKDGNVLTVANFTKNDIFGGNLLFSNNNVYPMTSTCLIDCSLISFSKELILELCGENREFLLAFLNLLSDKTLLVTDILHNLTHKTIREMIINYLKLEYDKQKNPVIKLNITKQTLAEKFGVQRPSLSRELNKMRSDGLLTYDACSITVKNLDIFKQ